MKFRKSILIIFLRAGKYYWIIVDIKYCKTESLAQGEAVNPMALLTLF